MAYLLDSVILIDPFNAVEAATRYLQEHHHEVAISVITRAEVLTGFGPGRYEDQTRLDGGVFIS